MATQHPGFFALGIKALTHHLGPDAPGRAELRYLFKEIIMRIEEEAQSRCELIYIEACFKAGLYILDAITQRKCQFLHGGRSRFANVIARDRDGIPLRHLFAAECEYIGD